MRIAIVSTPFVRVPPQGYGGTELFCGHLANALLKRGHDVTLFATGDSEFAGELRSCFRSAIWPPAETVDLAHVRYCLHEISRGQSRYDAVQLNSALGLRVARDLGIPVVYTLHHQREETLSRIYAAHPEVHYVAISQRQLEIEVPLRHASVIHHGVEVDDYPTSAADEGYLLHLGRFAPEKGTHLAIDVAVRTGIPLVLAGRVQQKEEDQRYYESEVAPRLARAGSLVTLAGEADHVAKITLLRGARALLCPIEWEEPFGLVAIESMLTGTPVIGFARGSFPELIEDGITGSLVADVDGMVEATGAVGQFDRAKCAARARERFCADRMASDYERLFETALLRRSSPSLMVGQVSARPSRLIG